MQVPEPLEEHRWLQQLVGEWDFEHECSMGPDQPAMKSSGRQSTRAFGDLWTIGELAGALPDKSPVQSIITLGFDPLLKRFVGTFVTSCMTYLWPYNGQLDEARKVLTLDCEGPRFSGDGTMAKYQDIIEIIDRDHHTMTSRMLSAGGEWVQFMHGKYTRANET